MRTMTKERKKEGPRLKGKGRADAKASRQLLLLCIPAIIAYILFNYIPMGAAVIIPFKNYKFSKGILGSDWCGLANFKWIIQSVALDRALRNTVLYGLLFMVLSPVTNVIIALLLFEITSRRRLKTYQTIITFPNFMSMVIVGYIVYAILSPRTGLMNQIIHGTFFLAQGNGEEFCSLNDKQIQTYTRLYSREKLFVMQHGKVINQPKKGKSTHER